MISAWKKFIKFKLNNLGYRIVRSWEVEDDSDITRDFYNIYNLCKSYTLTSKNRCYALYEAVKYIVDAGVPGDIVECGAWKGGSAMIIACTLKKFGDTSRKIYLYDTYTGMPEPGKEDRRVCDDYAAINKWKHLCKAGHNEWCFAPLEEVKHNMSLTHYPEENIILVKGEVEKTIPSNTPEVISMLRLDTDWYSSTYHELVHLYPRISKRGMLVIDDYGDWEGSRKAVDKYFSEKGIKIFLARIDRSRWGIIV